MSFMYVPALLRIPDVPGFSPPDGVWRGVGKDYGLFAFRPGTSSWGYSVMTRGSFVYSLMVDGYELNPVYSTINGYIHWTGNGYLYNTIAYGWVYAASKFAGYEPIEENISYDEDTGTYSAEGDSFWSLWGSPPCRPDEEVELVGRGSNFGKGSKTLKAVWKRWKSDKEFGVYEGDGESGEKILGLPRFRSNGWEYFTRSYAKTKGRYTYGRIKYSDAYGKWVIGEVGSGAGWHEGSEPEVGGSVTFKFCRNEDSEATGSDITVSYFDHVKGDETTAAMLGEVAIWR